MVEHWLRVFEIKVLRETLVLKKEKVRAEWRRLHYREFYDLYFSMKYYLSDYVKGVGMKGACGAYGRGTGSSVNP